MQHGIPFPDISPVLVEISLGPIDLPIRWYALAYIAGILIGYWILRRIIGQPRLWKDDSPALDRKRLDDLMVWLILGVVLGGAASDMSCSIAEDGFCMIPCRSCAFGKAACHSMAVCWA